MNEQELLRRKELGLDRWDEVWDGVYHVTPAPTPEHQRVVDKILIFLAPLLEQKVRGTLRSQINVFDERSRVENYRIPDLTFVARDREHLFAQDGIRGGAPDAVFEIRSPGDDTSKKLSFYARIGVTEVIVIDRDTKKPEIHRLRGVRLIPVAADSEGWLTSEALGVRFRQLEGRFHLQDTEDPAAHVAI
jgi:Uma2 family endonuclease